MCLDKGDDFQQVRDSLAEFGFTAHIRARGEEAQQLNRDATKRARGAIPATNITRAEWNFAVGGDAALFEKLSKMPVKLGDVPDIFVGLRTSADTVFLFKDTPRLSPKVTQVDSKELGREVQIESALLKPVVRSGEIGRYWANPTAHVLFPYYFEGGKALSFPSPRWRRSFRERGSISIETSNFYQTASMENSSRVVGTNCIPSI